MRTVTGRVLLGLLLLSAPALAEAAPGSSGAFTPLALAAGGQLVLTGSRPAPEARPFRRFARPFYQSCGGAFVLGGTFTACSFSPFTRYYA